MLEGLGSPGYSSCKSQESLRYRYMLEAQGHIEIFMGLKGELAH